MEEIGLELYRQWLEEEAFDIVFFSANNGQCQSSIEVAFDEDLVKIGKALISFSKMVPDEYSYEIGSPRPEDGPEHFVLRAYTDNPGHTALEITIRRTHEPECCISFMVEPEAIHRLGELITKFSGFKYRTLNWSLDSDNDALIEWDHPEPPTAKERMKSAWKAIKKDFKEDMENLPAPHVHDGDVFL